MTSVQVRNDEQVELLRADFQARYEPNFSWHGICSMFLALPALRAFWPMSSVDYTNPQGTELSGNGYDLTNNNSADFGYDQLVPYVEFDGVNQYLSRADGGAGNWADIIGTEAYIVSTQRGLTIGGWFYVDTNIGTQLFIGKVTGAPPNRSYQLQWAAGGNSFVISDAAATYSITATVTMPLDTWTFCVGRFIPSTEIKIWTNDNTDINAVGMPAALNDTGAPFTIGATGVPGNYLDGRASMCFLCAAQLSDQIIDALFQQTRAMYNV